MEGAEINTTYGENSAVRRTFKAYNKTERPLLSLTWEALNQGNYFGELQQTQRIQTTVLGTTCLISGARVLLGRKHIFPLRLERFYCAQVWHLGTSQKGANENLMLTAGKREKVIYSWFCFRF